MYSINRFQIQFKTCCSVIIHTKITGIGHGKDDFFCLSILILWVCFQTVAADLLISVAESIWWVQNWHKSTIYFTNSCEALVVSGFFMILVKYVNVCLLPEKKLCNLQKSVQIAILPFFMHFKLYNIYKTKH